MKKLLGSISSIVVLILLCSGIFSNFVAFFTWLFVLDYTTPSLSLAGEIIVRVLTFLVSYSLVHLTFSFFGWFNSKAMSITYFIVSTLLGFAIAYVVWTIEKYILIIGIILGVLFLLSLVALILLIVFRKKKKRR